MPDLLTKAQIAAWEQDGFVIVEGILTATEVRGMQNEARRHFPSRDHYDRFATARPILNRGMAFQSLPYGSAALDSVAFHPRIIAIVEQLIGTSDLRLTQAFMHVTYGGAGTVDQVMHRDFTDNSLLTPSLGKEFGQIPIIAYLSDVRLGDAPTFVVSNRYGDERSLMPRERSPDTDPELYEHEVPCIVSAGSVLFYTMRTFHRGSTALDPAGYRLVHHAAYRASGCDWMPNVQAWPMLFDSPAGERCIEELSPRQRELLGIPSANHKYWTEATVADFCKRYPAIDAEPYLRLRTP